VALTREQDGWESRLRDGHPAAQAGQVPCSGARRQGKVLDVVSATIHGDAVAVNTAFQRARLFAIRCKSLVRRLMINVCHFLILTSIEIISFLLETMCNKSSANE